MPAILRHWLDAPTDAKRLPRPPPPPPPPAPLLTCPPAAAANLPRMCPLQASTTAPMADAQRYESVDVEAADGLIQSKGYSLLDVRCKPKATLG